MDKNNLNKFLNALRQAYKEGRINPKAEDINLYRSTDEGRFKESSRRGVHGVEKVVEAKDKPISGGYVVDLGEEESDAVEAPKYDVEEMAGHVILGAYGNGEDRKRRLAQEGYDYQAIQDVVNKAYRDNNLHYYTNKANKDRRYW